ncbi:unnamed protein product, partial [Trichogramma brassicae]
MKKYSHAQGLAAYPLYVPILPVRSASCGRIPRERSELALLQAATRARVKTKIEHLRKLSIYWLEPKGLFGRASIKFCPVHTRLFSKFVVRDRPFASEREIENYTLTHVMISYCCAKYCECVRFIYKKKSTKSKLEFKNSQLRSSAQRHMLELQPSDTRCMIMRDSPYPMANARSHHVINRTRECACTTTTTTTRYDAHRTLNVRESQSQNNSSYLES